MIWGWRGGGVRVDLGQAPSSGAKGKNKIIGQRYVRYLPVSRGSVDSFAQRAYNISLFKF